MAGGKLSFSCENCAYVSRYDCHSKASPVTGTSPGGGHETESPAVCSLDDVTADLPGIVLGTEVVGETAKDIGNLAREGSS